MYTKTTRPKLLKLGVSDMCLAVARSNVGHACPSNGLTVRVRNAAGKLVWEVRQTRPNE